jgi:predicted permease
MDNVLLFHLDPGNVESGDAARATFYERVQESLARIPGVKSATLSQHVLLGGWMSGRPFTLPGHTATGGSAHVLTISETFFDTMNVAILRGRGLRATDRAGSPHVAVVNETFAKKFLSDRDPVGVSMKIRDEEWQVVGVCGDAKYTSIKDDIPPTVYFSFRQENVGSVFFAVRSVLPPLSIVTAARRAVSGVDPNVPLDGVTTQRQQFNQNVSRELLFASLCGALALLAVFLSCIGVYGLMAYNVARRTNEIGIRMSLGATRGDIAWPIVREAAWLALAGVGVGLPVALGLTRFVRSQLFGVEPGDPWSLAGAAVLLITVACLSAWFPARRAARIAPMEALRCQ